MFPKNLVELVLNTLQDIGTVQLFDIKIENKFLKRIKVHSKEKLYKIIDEIKNYKDETEASAEKSILEWLIGPKYVVADFGKKKKDAVLKEAEALLKEMKRKYRVISKKNALEIKKLYYQKLLLIFEYFEDIKARVNALEKFGRTKHTASFGCFVTEENASKLMNTLDIATGGKCAFEIKKLAPEDAPPTMLSNPTIIKPFEVLTENYGMPHYNGIDPTFIIAVTFPFLFGVMFPDIGYGIILASLSSIVYFVTRKTTKFIRNFNIILVYCGLSSVIFGFLFGEFFGGLVTLKPFLFEPLTDILRVLVISILIGVVHISIGFISNIFSENKRLYYIALLTTLWSFVLLLLLKNNFYFVSLAIGIILLFYAKGFYLVEELATIFVRVISYLRIGILSITHITISRLLAQAALVLSKDAKGILLGSILIIIGILLSLIIGVLVVFIQSLRLHWLEFFSTYRFGGKKFEPFSHKKEYLYTI